MSVRENGGPAFPAREVPLTDWGGNDVTSGMTLRDWFAGQSLASIPLRTWGDPPPADVIQQWARAAYKVADAMLAERSALPLNAEGGDK